MPSDDLRQIGERIVVRPSRKHEAPNILFRLPLAVSLNTSFDF